METRTHSGRSSFVLKKTDEKLALTVLAGGPSGERDISLQSGQAVADALKSRGHSVHLEDIGPNNLSALAREVDCVFVALHGKFGEDGAVQEILDQRGLSYCGSGPKACTLAMNKVAAKKRFLDLGLPTPRWALATKDTIEESLAAWSLPIVAKPVSEGSSLNCHIIREFEEFRLKVEQVIAEYGECLVEEYIPGMEIAVGILGETALPPVEIRTKRDFYDYQAKYVDEDTEYGFDIDLPTDLLERVVKMSVQAHNGVGCRDFSRVDWRIDTKRLKPYLLEINVIPGLTAHSLLPKAANQAGLGMAEMCQFIVDSAIKRSFSKK